MSVTMHWDKGLALKTALPKGSSLGLSARPLSLTLKDSTLPR